MGAVVDDDELEVLVLLPADAFEAAAQVALGIVHRDDDADERHFHSSFSFCFLLFFIAMILPPGRKSKRRRQARKGGFGMIFHIAVCSPDSVLRSRVERQCLEYYARRADACIVEQLPGVDALLARDAEGTRYELYLVELTAGNAPAGLKAADTLRRHGARAPLAFFAHTPAHAYNAYRVDAMQYLLLPFRPEQFTALLDRATEPEYGPVIAVSTAAGLRALPFANIEYLECTHHVVHFHLASGEDVPSLSVRVPFAQVAQPLLADERFVQLHRSYVVNLAAVSQLAAGEFWMQSGARVPVPRGREPAARTALKDYLEKQFR